MATRPKLKPLALILIVLLSGALAAGNFFVLTQAPFGSCTFGIAMVATGPIAGTLSSCSNYIYYFVGAPLVIGLLLLLILPSLVKTEATPEVVKPTPAPIETKKPAPPPAPPRPATDAAVQLLALFQREGRLVDFLREDIQPYDDAQIGAAVRTIHQACRQVLTEHLTLEPVLKEREGDDIVVQKDFDPSAVRLTGNVAGEPPFRGTVRHTGWRATQIKLPTQPPSQDPKIVAPAEVEIP
jgi:hypothetical protein